MNYSLLVSQKTRNVTDSEKAFWTDKDAGVHGLIPPVPCRDCGLVWEHDPNCASFWDVDEAELKHGDVRHGKVWCLECKEWIDETLTHARLVIREVRDEKERADANRS